MNRLTKDEYFIELVKTVAKRSTCIRREVGCILVDKYSHIVSTGYNGVPIGAPHCILEPCIGASSPSGTDLHACKAIHAEQNAIIQCTRPYEVVMAICTTAPCIICTRMLLNLPNCNEILFINDYPHLDAKDEWIKADRIWRKFQ